uniref:RING-type domain-containing protein n=1 Tax=Oreochromis aureus TaxID=47969 RepID=A0A668SY86_OREAU
MALAAENRHEAPQECPVCFENVLLAKRTLSCRHVFCQDCLSKIMVVARSRGSIICPLCRQATYLNKESQAGETLAADVDTTQEVALPLSMGYLVMASRASIVGLLHGGNWMMHHLRRLSRRSSEQTVTYRNGSQVFIISDQVRPTTCSDTAVGIPEAEPPECTECRVTKSDCICLVVVICLTALVSLLVSWINHCSV